MAENPELDQQEQTDSGSPVASSVSTRATTAQYGTAVYGGAANYRSSDQTEVLVRTTTGDSSQDDSV